MTEPESDRIGWLIYYGLLTVVVLATVLLVLFNRGEVSHVHVPGLWR